MPRDRKEYIRKWKAAERARDPEKAREYCRAMYAKHAEARRQYAREYREKRKEELARKAKERYLSKKDEINARRKIARKKHAKKAYERTQDWLARNPDRAEIHHAKRVIAEAANLRVRDIPDDVAALKVMQLKIHRFAKDGTVPEPRERDDGR